MSNIVEPQIVNNSKSGISNSYEYLPYGLPPLPKVILGNETSTPVLCKDGTTQNQLSSPNAKYADACRNNGGRAENQQNELAKQQAMLQEVSQMTEYIGLTDKVFGKQGGWSFERPLRLGAYIIVGAVVGKYVAKKINKSTTFGMVIGGLAPLLAYQLSIQYDRKKMPKQEPKKPVAIEPKPMTDIKLTNKDLFLKNNI